MTKYLNLFMSIFLLINQQKVTLSLTQLLQKQWFLRGNVLSFDRRTAVLEVSCDPGQD